MMPKKLCCQFDRRVSEGSTSATPCSTSSSLLDDPEPSATCSSSSSSPSSWYGSYLGLAHELRPIERTTSPLQIGHVRRRVVNHGVLYLVSLIFSRGRKKKTHMQSAWNSWPQGSLMTLLTPSIYSSRQTTHSTCLPIYFLHSPEMAPLSWPERPARGFVCSTGKLLEAGVWKFALSKTPLAVLERGRGLLGLGLDCSSGVVAVAPEGEETLGDRLGERATVW